MITIFLLFVLFVFSRMPFRGWNGIFFWGHFSKELCLYLGVKSLNEEAEDNVCMENLSGN